MLSNSSIIHMIALLYVTQPHTMTRTGLISWSTRCCSLHTGAHLCSSCSSFGCCHGEWPTIPILCVSQPMKGGRHLVAYHCTTVIVGYLPLLVGELVSTVAYGVIWWWMMCHYWLMFYWGTVWCYLVEQLSAPWRIGIRLAAAASCLRLLHQITE